MLLLAEAGVPHIELILDLSEDSMNVFSIISFWAGIRRAGPTQRLVLVAQVDEHVKFEKALDRLRPGHGVEMFETFLRALKNCNCQAFFQSQVEVHTFVLLTGTTYSEIPEPDLSECGARHLALHLFTEEQAAAATEAAFKAKGKMMPRELRDSRAFRRLARSWGVPGWVVDFLAQDLIKALDAKGLASVVAEIDAGRFNPIESLLSHYREHGPLPSAAQAKALLFACMRREALSLDEVLPSLEESPRQLARHGWMFIDPVDGDAKRVGLTFPSAFFALMRRLRPKDFDPALERLLMFAFGRTTAENALIDAPRAVGFVFEERFSGLLAIRNSALSSRSSIGAVFPGADFSDGVAGIILNLPGDVWTVRRDTHEWVTSAGQVYHVTWERGCVYMLVEGAFGLDGRMFAVSSDGEPIVFALQYKFAEGTHEPDMTTTRTAFAALARDPPLVGRGKRRARIIAVIVMKSPYKMSAEEIVDVCGGLDYVVYSGDAVRGFFAIGGEIFLS
jgi:hypothetical protein